MYRCLVCKRVDRRARLIGHVLKNHISLDRAPFGCRMCNFRCTEKEDLASHVEYYARHKEEAKRIGGNRSKALLTQSTNPIHPHTLIVKCTKEERSEEMVHEALVPDWLLDDGDLPPPSAPTGLDDGGEIEKVCGLVDSGLDTPTTQ